MTRNRMMWNVRYKHEERPTYGWVMAMAVVLIVIIGWGAMWM